MKDATLKRTVTIVLFVGLGLVLIAIYLAMVPKLQNSMGMQGVSIIAGIAGLGLVLMLPAKIMLTLWLMTKGGENKGDTTKAGTTRTTGPMQIRESKASDKPAIRAVHYAAFDAAERDAVAGLAIALLDDPSAMPLLSLVAEDAEQIVGHVLFTGVAVDGSAQQGGYIMAPLAVLPDRQQSGVGKALIREGLTLLKDRGATFVMVLGDPDYYTTRGFHGGHHIKPPHEIPYPEAWLAQELRPGILDALTGTLRCAESLAAPEYW